MPELSVVIPTYNRVQRLRACLEALARQTQSATDFEVIVVVDGSTDGTREMLARLAVPYALTVLWQENRGQQVARNRGVAAARGRFLLFLDDDILAEPPLVAEHLGVQRSSERVVGIGQITIALPPTADSFTRRFAEGWREHYEELNRGTKEPSWIDCYGGNLSMERSTFQSVNGFAEDVRRSHDIELGYRLAGSGASFAYVPGAIGGQDERKGIRELSRDFRSAGIAYVQLAQKHPAMLPALLGGLAEANLRERLLRRTLCLMHVPPRMLGWMSALISDPVWSGKWFRFLQNYFYWCGVREAITDGRMWRQLMHGTPILMYHAFGSEGHGSRFIIPVRRFARQMQWLHRMGYRVIGMEEFLRYRREHRLPPPRSVVITVDDAYADTISEAWPILRRYGYPATVFVVSNRVGAANSWSNGNGLHGRRLLSWDEIAQMARDGIEFGAHTGTHARLTALSEDEARREMVESKNELERRLRAPVHSFAYPYGAHDPAVDRMVEETGYWGACGIDPGLNTPGTPLYALHRVEIEGATPLFRFLLALRIGDTRLRFR